MPGYRHRAGTAETGIEAPLRRKPDRGARVVQRRQQRLRCGIARAALDADDTLCAGRDEAHHREAFANARRKTQPREPGVRKQDRVELSVVELAQARADIAAQLADREIGPKPAQLRLPAQARGSHNRALRQRVEIRVPIRDEGIARVLAGEIRGKRQALRQMCRHVLHRMHGDVGAAIEQRRLQFLDEQPLAADRREAAIEQLIALRGHRHEPHREARMHAFEQAAHVFRLPQGERAFTGGDAEIHAGSQMR